MKHLLLILRLAIAVGILGYLVARVGLAEAYEHVLTSNVDLLAAGTGILALQPIVGALRWRVILAALGSPSEFSKILRWNYIGVFFGQALPATVGADAIRIVLAGRDRIGWRDSLVSVALDRILMLIILSFLLLAGLPFVSRMLDSEWVNWLIPLFAVGGIAGLIVLANADRLPAYHDRFRLVRALRFLAKGVRRVLVNPMLLGSALGLCLLSYIGLMTSVMFYAKAFGANGSVAEIMILLPPVLVASMLPVSIGGWGTREFAMVAALGLVGIPEGTALLASVWMGISSILIALPGALYFMFRPIDLHKIEETDPLAQIGGSGERQPHD